MYSSLPILMTLWSSRAVRSDTVSWNVADRAEVVVFLCGFGPAEDTSISSYC